MGVGQALSLSTLVNDAIKNSPELHLAQENQHQSEIQLSKDRAGFYPNVSLIASLGGEGTETIPTDTSVESTMYVLQPQQAGVSATLNLFKGFQTVNTIKQHKYELNAKEINYRNTLNTIKFNTFEASMAVIISQDNYELSKKHLKLAQKTYDVVNAKYKIGIGNKPDVAMALAMVFKEKKKLSNAKSAILKSRSLFFQQVGIAAPDKIEIPAVPDALLPSSFEELQNRMSKADNSLAAAVSMERSAAAGVAVSKGAFSPTIDLDVIYEKSDAAYGQDSVENHQGAFLTLSWNLFNGGADHASYRQAISNKMSASDTIRMIKKQLTIEAINNWQVYQTIKDQLPLSLSEKNHLNKAYLGFIKQVSVGRKNISELLNAERSYIEADDNYLSQQTALMVSSYKLCELTGDLSKLIK